MSAVHLSPRFAAQDVGGSRSSVAALIATFVRLPLLAGLLWSIADSSSILWLLVLALIVADVLDGVLARRLGSDTRGRRISDALLDRVSIHSAFVLALSTRPAFAAFYIPLALRDAVALGLSARLLATQKLLLIGGRWHKLASLSSAMFGLAIVYLGGPTAAAAALAAIALNLLLLLDYAGGYLRWTTIQGPPSGRYRVDRLTGIKYLWEDTVRRACHRIGARRAQAERHRGADFNGGFQPERR